MLTEEQWIPVMSPVPQTETEWVRWKSERHPFPLVIPKEGMYWHWQAADSLI